MNSNSVKLKLLKDISDAIGDEHPGWYMSILTAYDDPDEVIGIIVGSVNALEDHIDDEAMVYKITSKIKSDLN